MNRRTFMLRIGGMLLSGGLLMPRQSDAIGGVADIVNDPINLVQNTFTALRSLISNANEVTQIQNQVLSLANEAKQLVTLPLSLVSEIDQAIQSYTELLNTGKGIAFSLTSAVQQFDALYASGFGGNGDFMQRASRMMDQMRTAGRIAVQATAVFDRLCAQQARVGKLMAASQAAVGSLQAEQAGNQLLGVMAEQQVSMQELLATDQRLKISESMRMLVIEEQAYANAQAFNQGMVVKPIRGPGEGQGFTLPE
jgi:type IV secretion system protein TrbJ